MYVNCLKSGLVAGTAIAAGMAGNAAVAQEGAAPLEEIIVTAQKREERLLEVPMTVAAISGAELTEGAVVSTLDLAQVTPGIVMTNNGLAFSPSVRGVSSSGSTPGDETNTSIYLDDVYIGSPLASYFDLADIERIEVLKGPQGTLFGRNATGGAIRIVTRSPSFTPQASLSTDYGFDFNETKIDAYLTGPFSDKVAGSLTGSYRKGDGYIDGIGPNEGRHYADPDNYVVRGKMLFRPSESFQATVSADTWQTQNNVNFAISAPKGVNPNPIPGVVSSQPYEFAGSTQPLADVSGWNVSLDASWEPTDSLTVRSITAYRDFEGDYKSDLDRSSQSGTALGLGQWQENFSQEFNFSSPGDQAFSWLAGLYYYKSDAGNPYWTIFLGDAPTGTKLTDFTSEVNTESYAGYGDATWNATDKLHLTLGARYTSETKEYHYRDTIRPAPLALRDVRDEKTWDSPTYRAVARYDFTDDANVYVSFSNGFKSGVYNAYSALGIPVNPEEIDAVEIGTKARVGGINLAAAAYAYKYDDLQVQSHMTLNGVIVQTLANAANAKMLGVEFTADGRLTERLSFNAGVNLLPTAEYEDFTTASVVIPCPTCTAPIIGQAVSPYDASGSRLIKAPEWTANLRLTYTAPLMGGEFMGTISDAYNPGFYWQAGDLTKEPSYNLANVRMSWTDGQDRMTYSLWCTNLTDEYYSFYTVPNVRGNTVSANQPRQVGVGVAVRF